MHNAFVAAAEENANPLIPALPDLIWGTIAFLIVLFFFLFYALPRINAALDARREAIQGNIEKADEAQKQAEAALEQYTAQLADARKEAGEIREAAREDGKKIVAEAKDAATAEAARISSAAQAQIEAERQAAFVSLKSEVGSLALDLAGGVIGEKLADDKAAQGVVDRFLAELEASESAQKAST
jgi:F-type H+-transporting ATPase subunit b